MWSPVLNGWWRRASLFFFLGSASSLLPQCVEYIDYCWVEESERYAIVDAGGDADFPGVFSSAFLVGGEIAFREDGEMVISYRDEGAVHRVIYREARRSAEP